MNNNSKKDMTNLVDELVEDVLGASDEDILSDAIKRYGSLDALENMKNNLIEKAMANAGKERMKSAETALKMAPNPLSNVVKLPINEKRSAVLDLIKNNPAEAGGLTLAARQGGEELSDQDVDVMYEAFIELGLIDENGG